MTRSRTVVSTLLWSASFGAAIAQAGQHVIDMRAAEGKPYQDAARRLVRAMAADDPKAIDAAFAGAGADRKLLDAAVAANRAADAFADAMVAKFGPAAVPAPFRHPFTDSALHSIDVCTVIAEQGGDPDRAAISPGRGLPVNGYELARRDGQWVVTSITVFPKDRPAMTTANDRVAVAYANVTKRVAAGDFATPKAAQQAAGETLRPIIQAYRQATQKVGPANRR